MGYLSAKKGVEWLLKVYKRIVKYMYKASYFGRRELNPSGTNLLYTLSPSHHPDRNHSGLQGWHLLIS